MEWILENMEWIFSGVGIAVLGYLYKKFFYRKESSQQIDAGDNSTNIQGGKNVNVNIGEKKQ